MKGGTGRNCRGDGGREEEKPNDGFNREERGKKAGMWLITEH